MEGGQKQRARPRLPLQLLTVLEVGPQCRWAGRGPRAPLPFPSGCDFTALSYASQTHGTVFRSVSPTPHPPHVPLLGAWNTRENLEVFGSDFG